MLDKKKIIVASFMLFLLILVVGIYFFTDNGEEKTLESKEEKNKLVSTVLNVSGDKLTIQDANHGIYTISQSKGDFKIGDHIAILYTGILDKNVVNQSELVVQSIEKVTESSSTVPESYQDDGIFKNYYAAAYKKMKRLSLDEKIGQLLLVRYPDNGLNEMKKYHLGGYVFFAKDFANKSENEVKQMISELQSNSDIPLLTAVDEEGGKVVRISSNPNLVSSPYPSSQSLYQSGGFEAIRDNTIDKSRVLKNLGLNVNLAPVVDVSTDPNAYMYDRTIGLDTAKTSQYAKTVIEASHGTSVSYTLKHFPGYGNNADTHQNSTSDTRTLENLRENDFPPFEAGIKARAEAVLVSHNTLTNIDSKNPASLSPTIHNLLRNDLGFTGIVITDDIAMGATANIDHATVKAIQAGNDLIITTDYKESITDIKEALNNGDLSEEMIDKLALRVLSWKYYKGLLFDNEK